MSMLWSEKVIFLPNPNQADEKNASPEEMHATLQGLQLNAVHIQQLGLDEERKKHTFIRLQIELEDALEEQAKLEKRAAVQNRLQQWAHQPNQQWRQDRPMREGRPQAPNYGHVAFSGFLGAGILAILQALVSGITAIVLTGISAPDFIIMPFLIASNLSPLWLPFVPCVAVLAVYLGYHYQLWRWEQQPPLTSDSWLLELNTDNISETEQQLEALFPSKGEAITENIFSTPDDPLKKSNFYIHRKDFEKAFDTAITISDTKNQLACLENLLAHVNNENNKEKTKKFQKKLVEHFTKFDITGKPEDKRIIELHMQCLISLGRERDAQDLNEKYSKKFHQKDAFYFRNEIWILQLAIDKKTAGREFLQAEEDACKSFDEMRNKLEVLATNYKGQYDENQPMSESNELKIADLFKKIFDAQFVVEENLFQQQFSLSKHLIQQDINSEDGELKSDTGLEDDNEQAITDQKIPLFDFLVKTKLNCEQKIENNYFKSAEAKQIWVRMKDECQSRLKTMMFKNPNVEINKLKNSPVIELYKNHLLKKEINSYEKQKTEAGSQKIFSFWRLFKT